MELIVWDKWVRYANSKARNQRLEDSIANGDIMSYSAEDWRDVITEVPDTTSLHVCRHGEDYYIQIMVPE